RSSDPRRRRGSIGSDISNGISSGISSDVSSDVSSGVSNDIGNGISSGISSGVSSDVSSGISRGISSDIGTGPNIGRPYPTQGRRALAKVKVYAVVGAILLFYCQSHRRCLCHVTAAQDSDLSWAEAPLGARWHCLVEGHLHPRWVPLQTSRHEAEREEAHLPEGSEAPRHRTPS